MGPKRKRGSSDDIRTSGRIQSKKQKQALETISAVTTTMSPVTELSRTDHIVQSARHRLNDIFYEDKEMNAIHTEMQKGYELGFAEATRLAIIRGKVSFESFNGRTILHRWAIGTGSVYTEQEGHRIYGPLWEVFLKSGVRNHVNVLSEDDERCAVALAIAHNNTYAVSRLTRLDETDLNMRVPNDNGNTILMRAVLDRKPHIISILFSIMQYRCERIDTTLTNNNNQTLYAIINGLSDRGTTQLDYETRKLKKRWGSMNQWFSKTYFPGIVELLNLLTLIPLPVIWSIVMPYLVVVV